MIDANHQATQEKVLYSYDGVDRLVGQDYPGSEADVAFTYNVLGQRTAMQDATGGTNWLYDELGRPLTITSPISGTVGYRYNVEGQRTQLIYPDGKQVHYTQDALGRMVGVKDWGDRTITYTYNTASWLLNTRLPNGVTITNTYDAAGQLTKRTQALGGFLLSQFEYRYNAAGNRTAVTETVFSPYQTLLPIIFQTSGGGAQMSAGASGPTQLAPQSPYPAPLESTSSDSSSKKSDPTPTPVDPYPAPKNGEKQSTLWPGFLDFIGWLLGWDAATASAHPAEAAPPAPAAISLQELAGGLKRTVIEYSYDPLNRLTAADYSSGTYFHYAYDPVGNRTSQATASGTTGYVYDSANRLTGVNGTAYTWDANGNLLNDGSKAYTYDPANRLKTVSGGQSYAYNGLGDRVQQVDNGVATNYALDLAGGLTQVLADGTGVYLYGNGRVAQHTGAQVEYFLGDALGSVRQLVDGGGNVTLVKSYAPYGEVLGSAGSGMTSYGFTNEYTSQGLINLRARWYAPGQGRFLSRDTWQGDYARPMSYNGWLYVAGNPVNAIDPSGHCEAVTPDGRCAGRETDYRDLTDWLYREMVANSNSPEVQRWRMWNNIAKGLAIAGGAKCLSGGVGGGVVIAGGMVFHGTALWEYKEAVKDGAKWDFKDQIGNRLGPGITLCSHGQCYRDIEYSVPGNIHFAYIGAAAGIFGAEVNAGAAYAEITDPSHNQEDPEQYSGPYVGPHTLEDVFGGTWWNPNTWNFGDERLDHAAVNLGLAMWKNNKGQMTFGQFKIEIGKHVGSLSRCTPNTIPVQDNVAREYPYSIGYFNNSPGVDPYQLLRGRCTP